jgi:DNA-binding NarL/FixJ family response regulator
VATGGAVKVVVALLDPLVERGLADVLEQGGRVVVLEGSLDETTLERVVEQRRPQVVLLGEGVGHDLLRRLRANRPEVGLVLLVHRPAALYSALLLDAGVSCFAHDAAPDDVLAAVESDAHGRPVAVCRDGPREPTYRGELALLTARETDVLRQLIRGRTTGEIALALRIRPETVKTHAASVRRKLNVRSSRELIGLPLPPEGRAHVTQGHHAGSIATSP